MDGRRMGDSSMTPAEEREARRRLRRVAGDGTPEEQAREVFRKAFERQTKKQVKKDVTTLAKELVNAIFGALRPRV